jgi:DinB family protein
MRFRIPALVTAVVLFPRLIAAQTAPVAQAFRDNASEEAKNLVAAAELMPADKYSFKPTPAQMTFGAVVVHLSGGNDYFCGLLGGVKPPTRAKIEPTASKEALVARLKETFQFCNEALAKLDDSKLSEEISLSFMPKPVTRAALMTITTGDWADHYSQSAIYLRLNGILPPTAKKP